MDNLYQRLAARQRLIVHGYWAFIGVTVVTVTGYLTSEWDWDNLDDQIPVLASIAIALAIHWCALFSTGTLSDTGFWYALGQRIKAGPLGNWPRMLAVCRWLFAVPALAVQFSVIGTVLVICYLALAARIGTNVIFERDLAPGSFGVIIVASILFLVIGSFALVFFAALAYRIERLLALLYSHAIIAGLSFYTLMVLGITIYLQLAVFGDSGTEMILVLLYPAAQFTLSLGSLIRLCFGRTSPALCQPQPTVLPEPISGFSGRSSLSSARVFATSLLLVSYIAIDVSIEHANDMGTLQETRSLLAAMASDEIDQQTDGSAIERQPLGHLSRVQEEKHIFFGSRPEIIRVNTYDGRTWLAAPAPVDRENDLTPVDLENDLIGRLAILAQQIDVEHDEGENLYQFFSRVERQLLENKQVSIPVVGVPVKAGKAAWVLVVVTLLVLILIRSRIRRVFSDSQYAREESWLILDGRAGLERYAAYLWLVLLAASVWITHLGLLMTLGAHIPAQGGVTTLYGDLLRFGAALVIFALAVGVGHDTISHLLTLRRLRREESVDEA